MNHVGSETHRPARRSIGVTRNVRRLAAVGMLAAVTLATVQADTAGAVVSCSLRVVDRTADSMTLAYEPHDNTPRTVWVDGQPTTIAPHTTAVVRRADTLEYPTQGEVVDVAELVALCGDGSTTTTTQPTTTTSSTTTSTTQPTTTTSALTTITVIRTTPEPTTSTAPLPPATWTVVDPTTTTELRTPVTLPETGGGDTAAAIGLLLWFGGIICLVLAAAVLDQIRRKDDGR